MCFGLFEPFKGIRYNIWLQYGNLVCIVLSTIATNLFYSEENISQIFYVLFSTNLICFFLVFQLGKFRFSPNSQAELLVK